MATKSKSYKFTQVIDAPALEVYSAFTNATALCEWLCNVSQADAHESGRLYLWWNSGYYAVGEYITLKLGQKITFSWHGRGEPGITRVKVTLKPGENGATKLKLEHLDLNSGKSWRSANQQIRRGWEWGLENLKSVLETGKDLRIIQRPLLGITGYDEISPDSSQDETRSQEGIRIHGVVDGMGAQGAGLAKDDIIVKLGNHKVSGQASLEDALAAYRSGDKTRVTYYRDGKRQAASLVLSQRVIPEIPHGAEDLAELARIQYQGLIEELEGCIQDIPEAGAQTRLSQEDWSPREVLAHLIASERETQSWIASLVEGQEADFQYHTNVLTRIRATIATFPTLPMLLMELKRCTRETIALIAALPAEFVRRKRSYWRLGYAILDIPAHFENHIKQIREILANVQVLNPGVDAIPEADHTPQAESIVVRPENGTPKPVEDEGG